MHIIPPREAINLHPLARRKWNFDKLPSQLKLLQQWVPCYIPGDIHPMTGKPVESPKVPIGGPTSKNMTTFHEVTSNLVKYQHFGICLKDDDFILGIDVDNLPEMFTFDDLPQKIKIMIKYWPTYAEISPSGCGLHLFYRTNKAVFKHRKAADKGVRGFEGAVYIRDQFLTCTGHQFYIGNEPLPEQCTIADTDAEELEAMLLQAPKVITHPKVADSIRNQGGIPNVSYSLQDVQKWLSRIPATLSESPLQPIIKRCYTSFDPPITEPDDYTHWQYMAAAVHFACDALGKTHKGAEIFDEWSASAPAKYDGSESTISKYYANPPKYDGTDITHLTLTRMYHSLKPEWPYEKMKQENGIAVKTGKPEITNLHNWQTLMDFYGISLQQNEISKQYRVAGYTQTLARYFNCGGDYASREGIESAVLYFGQDNAFTTASTPVANAFTRWWTVNSTAVYNPIKEWIDSVPAVPESEGSHFQALWETLRLPVGEEHREELYRSYLKKNLMGVIRAHYYTGRYGGTTGIVILQGPEKSRKSVWCMQLLPRELNDKYTIASQVALKKSAVKELQLEAGISQILVKDEVEGFLSSGDAVLKNFLIQEYDTYRPLFGKEPIKVKRKCIFFGTTNSQEMTITDDGSRRIMIIPIEYCDTAAQAKIDMGKVYRELLTEFEATPQAEQPDLWVLSDEEQKLTNSINTAERKAEPELDMLVREAFAYGQEFNMEQYLGRRGAIDYKKLLTHTQVKKIIAQHHNMPEAHINIAAMKHTLRRLNAEWVDIPYGFDAGAWKIKQGWATYTLNGMVKKSGWIMPMSTAAAELAGLDESEFD